MGNMEIYKSCAYKNEKKNAKAFIFFSSLLSLLSAVWLLYLIPMSVNFVATFKVSDLVLNQFTLDSYIVGKTSVLASGYF
jgi:sec-independent protein translocase protein TatC